MCAVHSIVAWLNAACFKVMFVDRYSIAHSSGSSHGYSRVIRKAYFEDPKCITMTSLLQIVCG
jgi:hypothetical protein